MAGATSTATDLPLKIITGADAFGASLKDAMVSHIRSLGIDVEDTGVSSYYSAGSEVGRRVSSASSEARGLVCCGTGVGVAMFANKFPGVYAATCLTVEDAANARSISDCNVLALSGAKTSPETAAEIFDAWIGTRSNPPAPLPDRSRGAPRSPPSSTTPSPRWIRSENQPPAIRLLVRSAAWRRTESSLRWRSCREDR